MNTARVYLCELGDLTGMPLYNALHWARQEMLRRLEHTTLIAQLRSFAAQRGIETESLQAPLDYSYGSGVAFYGELSLPRFFEHHAQHKELKRCQKALKFLGFEAACRITGSRGRLHNSYTMEATVTVALKGKPRKQSASRTKAQIENFTPEGGLTESGGKYLERTRNLLEREIQQRLRTVSGQTTEYGYQLLRELLAEPSVLDWATFQRLLFTHQGAPVEPSQHTTSPGRKLEQACRCEDRWHFEYTGVKGVLARIVDNSLVHYDPEEPPLKLCERCQSVVSEAQALLLLKDQGIEIPESASLYYVNKEKESHAESDEASRSTRRRAAQAGAATGGRRKAAHTRKAGSATRKAGSATRRKRRKTTAAVAAS